MSKEAIKTAVFNWLGIDDRLGKRLPNLLTLLRFLLVPFFVILLIDPTPQSRIVATVVFLIASLTDWLDGYIARLYDAESIVGKLLDPLADKVLVAAALIMLCALPEAPRVPAWMVVVILSREIIVTGLRSLAAVKAVVVAANSLAKHKTAWTMMAIVGLLIQEPYTVFSVVVDFHLCGMIALWIALVLAIISGVQYAIMLKSLFSE